MPPEENASPADLLREIEALRAQLEDAEETLRAIRSGEVDAVVVAGERGQQIYSLSGAEHPYRVLIERMNDGAATLTPEGTILYCNHCLAGMLGRPLEELMGARLLEFVSPGGRAMAESLLQAAAHQPSRGEVNLLASNDTLVPALLALSSMELDKTLLLSLVVTNLTEQKRHEELRHLEQERAAADKLAAIGQLAGGIAHDFNNLMTTVLGFSQLLLDKLPQDHPCRAFVSPIQLAGERAALLTDRLLDFGGKQIMQRRELDLNSLIRQLQARYAFFVPANATLTVQLASDLGLVWADPAKVIEALETLIDNGLKAMPTGGQLTIQTANVELDDAFTKSHPEIKAGSYVLVAVSDTGCGMSAEQLNRLFEPFFTTKDRSEVASGHGLALAAAYGIIKQSGGHMWPQSQLGQGTTFRIFLPRGAPEAKPAVKAVVPAVAPPATSQAETILVVDDDESVGFFARCVLENAGFTVLQANSSQAAWQISQQHPGRIAVLVTDVVMPGLDGHQLAWQLHSQRPDLKVLFLSGSTQDFLNLTHQMRPGWKFMHKPYSGTALVAKVKELLSGKE